MEDDNGQFIQQDANPELYSQEDAQKVEAHILKYFGKCDNVFHEIYSPDIHVDIYLIPPTKERNYYTFVTLGMGAHRMNVPSELAEYKLERAELLITLPGDWKTNQEDMQDERWYWPIRLLKSVARLPGEEGSWIGWGHTVALNEGETYADNTQLCGTLLINQQIGGEDADVCPLSNGDEINFYQLMPLYYEEMEYKLEHDADSLLDLMDDVSMVVDIQRPNVMDDYDGEDNDNEDDYEDDDYDEFMEILMDDVDAHLESIREKNLPVDEITAYNHLAIYLRWCMEHDLMGDLFMSEYGYVVSAVQNSAVQNIPDLRVLLRDEEHLNGCLLRPYFNDEGAAFAEWYYGDGDDDSHYFPCDIDDYAESYFGTERYNSEEFQDEAYLFVPWTEQYYQDMARVIDSKYEEWKMLRDSTDGQESAVEYPFHITLQLNARFQPMHRHYLENALNGILEKQKLGEVDGGGTMQFSSGEIEYCDIEISLKDNTPQTIARLEEIINILGVPKGSKLHTYQEDMELPIAVGSQEGMALYLNGTELPDEVYEECDINYVIEHMEKLMDGIGKMYSYWEGPDNTALYFYGESFDKMLAAVEDFLKEYPLCQKCDLQRIA